jgi:hypothetical protein
MTLRLKLKFYPNQANPARVSGRGVWRVVRSYEAQETKLPPICTIENVGAETHTRYLYMTADRLYKSGSRVDPLKVALAVLRACTCHPADNPPSPCARRYALSECRVA